MLVSQNIAETNLFVAHQEDALSGREDGDAARLAGLDFDGFVRVEQLVAQHGPQW